MNRVHLIKR